MVVEVIFFGSLIIVLLNTIFGSLIIILVFYKYVFFLIEIFFCWLLCYFRNVVQFFGVCSESGKPIGIVTGTSDPNPSIGTNKVLFFRIFGWR